MRVYLLMAVVLLWSRRACSGRLACDRALTCIFRARWRPDRRSRSRPLFLGRYERRPVWRRSSCSAIFALSLELLVGQTGLVSFGHSAFVGIGAYTHRVHAADARSRVVLPADAAAMLVAGAVCAVRSARFSCARAASTSSWSRWRSRRWSTRLPRHQARRRQRRHLPGRRAGLRSPAGRRST